MNVTPLRFNDGHDFGKLAHDAYSVLARRFGWKAHINIE